MAAPKGKTAPASAETVIAEKGVAPLPKFDTTVFGTTGLRHAGGFLYEETLTQLRGDQGRRTFKAMVENDYTCGAVIFAMTALFRGAEWSVRAKDETPAGEEGKVFLEEVLKDMDSSFADVMSEVATMFVYGFAAHEILYKRRVGPKEEDATKRSKYTDGKIGIRGLPLRAQNSVVQWKIDDATGATLGMVQQPISGGQVTIPIQKMLLFRTTAERNNPEGRSILRSAWRAWTFKKRMEEIEGIGVERDLAGLPVGRIPSQFMAADADPGDKAVFTAWTQMISRIKRDQQEGVIIPSDKDQNGNYLFELSLLSTAGSRTIDTTKIIERYDRAIATSVLADFIFLGQQAVGSFALSSDKTALFAQSLKAFLDVVIGEFNRKLVPALWDLNSFPEDTMPEVAFTDVETMDLTQISALISTMTGAGAQMFPDRDLENHLRKMAGLPEAPEEGDEEGQPMLDEFGNPMAAPGAMLPGQEPGAGEDFGGGPEGFDSGGPIDPSRYFLGR